MKSFGKNVEILWQDTKRWCGLPITFTHYAIIRKEDSWIKLVCEKGFMHTEIEEILIFRIDDLSVYQSVIHKMFDVGNIEVFCKDASTDKLVITKVKNPYQVRNLISDLIEEDRTRRKVTHIESQRA